MIYGAISILMIINVLATAFDPNSPWAYVLNFGVLGVMFVLILSGKFVVTKRELDTCQLQNIKIFSERDEEKAEVRRLNILIQDKYVPALEAAKNSTEAILVWLRNNARSS